jgi:hypothetical protein
MFSRVRRLGGTKISTSTDAFANPKGFDACLGEVGSFNVRGLVKVKVDHDVSVTLLRRM